MTATIIDGKTAKEKTRTIGKRSRRAESTRRSAWLGGHFNRNDPASCSYVTGEAAETMGMKFKLDRFDSSLTGRSFRSD